MNSIRFRVLTKNSIIKLTLFSHPCHASQQHLLLAIFHVRTSQLYCPSCRHFFHGLFPWRTIMLFWGIDTSNSKIIITLFFFVGVMHHNNVYFWQFFMCELLNFAVLLVVISFTDFFLGGQFWGYGWRVYDHYITQPQTIPRTNSRPTPMCSLFPTVTS